MSQLAQRTAARRSLPALILLLAGAALAGCSGGDFGRTRADFRNDDMHRWMGAEATGSVGKNASQFQLTEHERQLRDLAYQFIEPPLSRPAWKSVYGDYQPLPSPWRQKVVFDRTAYGRNLIDEPHRSFASRYSLLIDQVRDDITRFEPFFATAIQVIELDRKRKRQDAVTLLGNYGYRLVEARDGIQALELARAELPDLIITDILMPNMDGFTLVRRLWAEPLLMGVRVIFQTASYDLAEIHKLSQASGIQYILRKPAEPHQILRAVNASLKRPVTHPRLPQTGQLQRDHLQLLADKLYEKVTELEKANEHLRSISLLDGMTGLNNRRGFMILATGLLKFARRMGYSMCLIYIDLDS